MCTETFCLESHFRSELLAEAREGNQEAFASLVRPYVQSLYQRALRFTGNHADAEEIRQEALLRAFSKLGQFDGGTAQGADEFRAWVARITSNAAIDVLRQRRDGRIFSYEDAGGGHECEWITQVATPAADPEVQYAQKEARGMLADAIEVLPADLRVVCLLRDVMQHSTQEVAARLGISSVAVRLRLFRAHGKLRESMRNTRERKRASVNDGRRKSAQRARFCAVAEGCWGD
jgi:RNA polymerase sigma factor (sigma-70 family)